jgi:hypothetical protein
MNKASIKLLIQDLKAAEKEILLASTRREDRELLDHLRTAIDDLRLTVWSSLVAQNAGPARKQYVESIRMNRVVDILRSINREKTPGGSDQRPFTFSELMRVAEEAINQGMPKAGIESKPR